MNNLVTFTVRHVVMQSSSINNSMHTYIKGYDPYYLGNNYMPGMNREINSLRVKSLELCNLNIKQVRLIILSRQDRKSKFIII